MPGVPFRRRHKNTCLWNNMPPVATQSLKLILAQMSKSRSADFRPMCHLKEHRKLSINAKYEIFSYGLKVIANVKVDNKQTNRSRRIEQCKIQKNWCTVTMAPTIEHHGGNSRTPANQRWDQVPGNSASPAWLAAPAMNARDTTKVYIWRLDTGCGPTLYRKCHSHNTPGKGIITLESNPSQGTVLPAPHGAMCLDHSMRGLKEKFSPLWNIIFSKTY